MHDSRIFDELLDEANSDRSVWADSAYRSEAREEQLREQGYKSRIHRRGSSRRALNKHEQATNHLRSKGRCPRRACLRRPAHAPGQHSGEDQGQGPGGGEDRADEPGLQHATAGVSAEAAIHLLHGLNGRKPADGGGKPASKARKLGRRARKKTISAAKRHCRRIDHADGGARTN